MTRGTPFGLHAGRKLPVLEELVIFFRWVGVVIVVRIDEEPDGVEASTRPGMPLRADLIVDAEQLKMSCSVGLLFGDEGTGGPNAGSSRSGDDEAPPWSTSEDCLQISRPPEASDRGGGRAFPRYRGSVAAGQVAVTELSVHQLFRGAHVAGNADESRARLVGVVKAQHRQVEPTTDSTSTAAPRGSNYRQELLPFKVLWIRPCSLRH
jgi:hypothetical protein